MSSFNNLHQSFRYSTNMSCRVGRLKARNWQITCSGNLLTYSYQLLVLHYGIQGFLHIQSILHSLLQDAYKVLHSVTWMSSVSPLHQDVFHDSVRVRVHHWFTLVNVCPGHFQLTQEEILPSWVGEVSSNIHQQLIRNWLYNSNIAILKPCLYCAPVSKTTSVMRPHFHRPFLIILIYQPR